LQLAIKEATDLHIGTVDLLGSKWMIVVKIYNTVLLLLAVICCYYTSAQSVLNVAPGIFSKKTESNGLILHATSAFQPITALTTNIYIHRPYTVKTKVFSYTLLGVFDYTHSLWGI